MNIGKVISVEYDKFRVKLFHSTKNSAISLEGQIYYFGNIGSYLKTQNAIGESILCEVIAVIEHNIEIKIYSNFNLDSSRELVIKPIGTFNNLGKFNLGIGIFPSIYADVSIVTFADIKIILSPTDSNDNSKIHNEIEIGISKNLINYKVSLKINPLFNIHTAILGNSGSGKSNTISHILQQIYRKENNKAFGGKTIVFDVNGEYQKAFENSLSNESFLQYYKPNLEKKSTSNFILPYYLMNLDEWLAFLMASDKTQKPFWDKVLQECYKFYKIFEDDENSEKYINYFKWKIRSILYNIISQVDSDTAKITAARGVIIKAKEITSSLENSDIIKKFLDDILGYTTISFGDNKDALSNYLMGIEIDDRQASLSDEERLFSGHYFDYKFLKIAAELVLLEEEGKGNSRIREFTSTMFTRLDYFLFNPDCNFMKSDKLYTGSEDFLSKVFNIGNQDLQRQLIIIDTSEIGNDILELTTSVISRLIFDFRKKRIGEERRKNPVHLVLDEAHRYIKKENDYILRENIFERIAREGRKFSLYLIVSSQRPSELSPTVLSQCGNYFIHRIQNEVDMRYIYSVLPYFSEDYVTKIKQSSPGDVLIFGNCVPMPLQVKVHQPVPDPNSENCIINEEWYIEEPKVEVKETEIVIVEDHFQDDEDLSF